MIILYYYVRIILRKRQGKALMKQTVKGKLNDKKGAVRKLDIVVIVVAVLVIIAALFPVVRSFVKRGGDNGCDLAIKRTLDMLRYEKIEDGDLDLETAQRLVEEKGSFCAAGGEFFVIEDKSDLGYNVVCGLHDTNKSRRAQLNAERALERLQAALADAKRLNDPVPETVELTLNSASLTAERRYSRPDITRGTYLTPGYEGIVALYVVGKDGELDYFCYADPDRCMRWRADYGWLSENDR